jgi:chromosome segregation ATPase
LPADVEAALLPAAFIEGYQFKVLQAKQCLSSHASLAELITQKEASQSRANDIKAKVEALENSCPIIVSEIDWLKARRVELRKELEAVTLALAEEKKRLEQLLNAIEKMKTDMKTPIREAIRLHKLIKPTPGSAEDDQREIDELDQIRLRAVDAIWSFLGLL